MSMINTLKGIAQDAAYALEDPAKIKNPDKLVKFCQVAKIVEVATAIVALAISLFSGPIALVLGGFIALAAHDFYKMTGNIQEVAESKKQGIILQKLKTFQEELYRIGKGTIIARPIFGLTLTS